MNFTNPLKFEILDRYKSEEVIVESVKINQLLAALCFKFTAPFNTKYPTRAETMTFRAATAIE